MKEDKAPSSVPAKGTTIDKDSTTTLPVKEERGNFLQRMLGNKNRKIGN